MSHDECPKCGGALAYYTQLGIYCDLSFCPKCEIVAARWMSFPYRCRHCDSELLWNEPRGDIKSSHCWWCGGTEFYTPPREDWGKTDALKPGYFKQTRKLGSCPNTEDGKHDLEQVWERAEQRDPRTNHLTVWPLIRHRCCTCGIEIYAGF